MSGGRLVVLDRLGRDVKRFPLASGLATLGSDPRCDIRVMLPTVAPHHATVVVHANQTVVRDVGGGETLVNGRAVSVAALCHGDVLALGGRQLRWEYAQPAAPRPLHAQPALALYGRARAARRRRPQSDAAAPAARSPALRLALELQQRASMPGSAGGKQVAIVQPQRRATTEQIDAGRGGPAKRQHSATKAELWIESRRQTPRSAHKEAPLRLAALRRAASLSKVPPPAAVDHTKQAAIMLMTGHTPKSKLSSPNLARRTPSFLVKKPSPVQKTPRGRKSSGGKSTPKSAKSSPNSRKSTPNSGKNTPNSGKNTPNSGKNTPNSGKNTPNSGKNMPNSGNTTPKSWKNTPNSGKNTPNSGNTTPKSWKNTPNSGKNTPNSGNATPRIEVDDATPTRGSSGSRKSSRSSASQSVTILEINDSDARITSPRARPSTRRSAPSPQQSPLLPSPRKSALKDPRKSKSTRKTESIKFDLSNLEKHTQNRSDVVSVADVSKSLRHSSDDLALRYSDTSSVRSPSPRKSIHSRSSRILEKSLGTTFAESPARSMRSTLTPQAPDSARSRSSRGSMIMRKALQRDESARYSRRTTKTDQSCDNTVASAFRTRTLSPRSPEQNLETYSIVDLVSMESNESGRSVYNSADSTNSSAVTFGTPRNSAGRKTRSTIDPALVESSTPYVAKVTRKSSTRSRSNPNISRKSSFKENVSRARSSTSSRRSKSLTTPDNTLKHISVNSTRVSRSQSRVSESDLLLISDNSNVDGNSPQSTKKRASKKSSLLDTKRNSSTRSSPIMPRKSSRKNGGDGTPSETPHEGTSTPENRHSPQQVGTPVLSIQSFLDSSQSSLASQNSARKGRASANLKRKTIGVIRTGPKNRRSGFKSKSLNFTARRGLLRLSNDSSTASDKANKSTEKMVTPKSAVKLVQEAVKNKHSTAKKPQSKRSIIDDLDESDIVKQLFNSPVKRKLSQSMTEFSRKQLFDDEEGAPKRRPTRNTIALTGRTPDHSELDGSEVYTPERFVSPIGTPSNSPDLTGIKRLFRKNTPDNDLSNVRGVKGLLRSPRTRSSIRNDLTDVAGVKRVFAKSPENRLSDVRLKEVFAEGPKNDLRRVSGVKSLFRAQKERKSPTNGLTDVRGVKKLFQKKSPVNDLRRVSGVKRALQKGSPKNDLSDVRGVKRMFREEKRKKDLSDVSGIEELFDESTASRDPDMLFDRLLGKPPIKAKYSKSLLKIPPQKPKTRLVRSLRESIDMITNNVEEWLERELQKRLHRDADDRSDKVQSTSTDRELRRLVTDTVEGEAPVRTSRARASGSNVSQRKSASELYGAHMLPIKKRSLVDKSTKESLGVPVDASGGACLPLKKRLLHSTPLKGRRPAAPALQRVSPIPAERDASIRSDKPSKEPVTLPETQPRGRRTTKTRAEAEVSMTLPETQPRGRRTTKTRAEAEVSMTLPETQPRGRRTTKTRAEAEVSMTLPETQPRGRRTTKTRAEAEVSMVLPETQPRGRRTTKTRAEAVVYMTLPETQPRGRRTTKTKAEAEVSTPKPSPKHTRAAAPSPPKPQATRTHAAPASPKLAKKNRPFLVIAKKSPVMSPKPASRTRRTKVDQEESKSTTQVNTKNTRTRKRPEVAKESPIISPKRARAGRSKQAEVEKSSSNKVAKPATPKRTTRAKVQKATVVVSKPSPQLKPRRGKAETEAPTRTTRKTVAVESADSSNSRDNKRRKIESPKPSKAKTRKTNEPKSKTTEPESVPETRRGRITRTVEVEQPKKNQKTESKSDAKPAPTQTRGALQPQASTQPEPAPRRRRGPPGNNTGIPETNTRKRKTAAEEVVPAKVAKKVAETKTTRGKKVAETDTTRGKKVAETNTTRGKVAETNTTRGKKVAETNASQEKKVAETNTTRGKKVVETNTARGMKVGETNTTRGKKVAETNTTRGKKVAETSTTRGKKAVAAQESEVTQKRAGRSKKAEVTVVDQPKTARSRKTTAAVEPVSVKTTRKRNTAASPVKGAARKPPAGRSTRARGSKQDHIEVPVKPVGRSRRR